MLLEELHGVFAEAAEEVVELAFVGVVDAEFVDGGGRLWSVGQGCGWEKSRGGQRLKQCASVHRRDCSRAVWEVKRVLVY
jgi:hypothetical protein